jgi:hypothetical protein
MLRFHCCPFSVSIPAVKTTMRLLRGHLRVHGVAQGHDVPQLLRQRRHVLRHLRAVLREQRLAAAPAVERVAARGYHLKKKKPVRRIAGEASPW